MNYLNYTASAVAIMFALTACSQETPDIPTESAVEIAMTAPPSRAGLSAGVYDAGANAGRFQ
jgi:hypothetical protein